MLGLNKGNAKQFSNFNDAFDEAPDNSVTVILATDLTLTTWGRANVYIRM